MSTTTTGLLIREQLKRYIGGLMEIGAQVGAGGSATTIVDAGNLKGRALPASLYDNAQLRVTSGTRAGETTFIDYVDPATGTIYVDAPLTGALADTDTYEIFMRGVDSDDLDIIRDDVLQNTVSTWRCLPITCIPDGDFETAGVTHWAAVSGATRTKALGGSPDTKGRWQLSVVHTTASSDIVDSDTMECQPNEIYFLEVPVKAYVTATSAAAKATLQPYDVTNTANISLGGPRTSHTGRGWGRIALYFQIPAGCYQFKVRLLSDTNASTTVWGPIACHHRDATEITLPDRIRTKKRVGRSFLTTQVTNSTGWVNNTRYKMRDYKNVERVQMGSNVELWFNPPLGNNACYYYERGYFAALQSSYVLPSQRSAGDSATTDAPVEYIAAAIAERFTKMQLDKLGAEWQDDWVRASAWLNYWEGQFGPEPVHIYENEQPVMIPHLKV